MEIDSFRELLEQYMKDNLNTDVYKLLIERDELWRGAVIFYKKAINQPANLFKSLEVQFSNHTGEEDSGDVGAMQSSFFQRC